MTDTMSLRGPDDGGLWISSRAAIGHRRLAVIDLPGGRQPMVEGHTVLTYSGEVYNYRELRRELVAAGHEFKTDSDTEVVLQAYIQWGVDMVHRLNGMYAFAIWDERTQELVLVRDRLGIKPLYYYQLTDGLLFGSEPKAILANPLASRVVNPAGFCGFLTLTHSLDGQTLFRDLFELLPGHYARFSRKGFSKHRYWALEARPHEDDLPTTIANVRGLLEDIVSRHLVSDVPLCMLLSGGLDSSVLAALAQRVLAGSDDSRGLRSFAVDFEGYVEGFQAGTGRETADQPFAREVAAHVGCTHRNVVLATDRMLDPRTRDLVVSAWDLPNQIGDLDISLYLLFQQIREHSTVAISGEGADEVFGGYPWAHDSAALQLPIFPWVAMELNRGGPVSLGLFSAELMESLKPLEYAVDLYNSWLASVPRLAGEDGEQARMREVAYFDLMVFMRVLLDRKDRMSMAVGLEVRVPYCDHRLVEYMFNAPWSMKKCDGREKSLLRKATEDLLPESVLKRRKAFFPVTQDNDYDVGLRAELKRIMDAGEEEPIRPHLDLEATRAAVKGDVESEGSLMNRGRLEGVVRANMWLKEHQLDMSGV